jgi:Ras-related GTP-binding protein A/B
MDLVPEAEREAKFQEKRLRIMETTKPEFKSKVECFKTSIWDETLYKAWSTIVSIMIPNIYQLEQSLKQICTSVNANEVVLFEKSTFLVISHYDAAKHEDVHRFEKISNIIKQFKLSCIKTNYKFQSMVVRNEKFSAMID